LSVRVIVAHGSRRPGFPPKGATAESIAQPDSEKRFPLSPLFPLSIRILIPFYLSLAFRSPFSFFLENNRGNRGNREKE